MNNNPNHGKIEISKALITAIGVIIAAIISGIFLLINSGFIQIGNPAEEANPAIIPTTKTLTSVDVIRESELDATPATDNASDETNESNVQSSSSSSDVTNYCYGNCWEYDDAARIMTWNRPADDLEDIWQSSDEALEKIRSGYTANFTTIVSGEIFACVLSVNGQAVKNDCDGVLYKIPAGSYNITSANQDIGGFRWCPENREWVCR